MEAAETLGKIVVTWLIVDLISGFVHSSLLLLACIAALLVALFPANVQYALDQSRRPFPHNLAWTLAAWLRLPLQAPMVWAALQARPRTQLH